MKLKYQLKYDTLKMETFSINCCSFIKSLNLYFIKTPVNYYYFLLLHYEKQMDEKKETVLRPTVDPS